MEEPDLRFVHETFDSYQPRRSKPTFFDLNPKGANPRFPAGASAGGTLK